MKSLSSITVFSLLLILAAGTAFAEREVKVTRVAQDVQTWNAAKAAAADCALGNQAVYYSIGDWIWGEESYAYIFDAEQNGCTCTEGFTVETAHIYMQFGTEDVPVSFDVNADFSEAAYDDGAGCWLPGTVACTTPAYTVTIDAPGLYDIALPMTPASCDCAYFGYKYAVSVNFLTAFVEYPDLITDNVPVGCTSWSDYGLGWLDLQDFGLPGETTMYVDVSCCGTPVSNESKTMGEMKSLFR